MQTVINNYTIVNSSIVCGNSGTVQIMNNCNASTMWGAEALRVFESLTPRDQCAALSCLYALADGKDLPIVKV